MTERNYLDLNGNYAAEILSYYLWGSSQAPKANEIADAKFIRENNDRYNDLDNPMTTVYIKSAEYMEKFSQYILLPHHRIYQYFFNSEKAAKNTDKDTNHDKEDGWGKKLTLLEIKNAGGVEENNEISLTHEQLVDLIYKLGNVKHSRHKDAGEDFALVSDHYKINPETEDHWMRSFAFGSTKFDLDKEKVRYVFDANTGEALRIDHIFAKPQVDNFDYKSNDGIARQVNPILRQITDPSGIGRQVKIEFEHEDNQNNGFFQLGSGSFTQQDYRNYIHTTSKPLNVDVTGHGELKFGKYPDELELNISMARSFLKGIKILQNTDIYNFRDEDDKVVIFGSGDNDDLSAFIATNLHLNKDIDISSLEGKFQTYQLSADIAGVDKLNKYRPYLTNGLTFVGGNGNDRISGSSYADKLYGNDDNDILKGNAGNDYLEGGTGFDTYVIEDADRLMDADGLGEIVFSSLTGNKPSHFMLVDAAAGIWRSINAMTKAFDELFTAYRDGINLVVKENASGHQVNIQDFFLRAEVSNELTSFLGIHLAEPKGFDISNTEGYVQFSGSSRFYQVYYPGKDSYIIYAGPKNDTLFGQLAQNIKAGSAGYALIVNMGDGHDLAFGSLHRDYIEGSAGTDVINGSAFIAVGSDKRSAQEKALDADTLVGGVGGDFLNGMAGDDTIHGGNIGDHLLTEASNAQGDWITGGDGNDVIYGSAAKDILQGGEGSDVIHGGANDDLILGDSFIRASVNFKRPTYADVNPITYEYRVDLETGQWKSQGYPMSTQLHPDEGKWTWRLSEDGKDYVITRVQGALSNDVHLVENGGDDYLYGGQGNDVLIGQTGNDVLHGQEGDDILYGDDNRQPEVVGHDHLVGGKGSDKLIGGKGQDSYYFSQEDMQLEGNAVVVDSVIDDGKDADGKIDYIYLDGKAINEMRWQYDEQTQLWKHKDSLWQMRLINHVVIIRYGEDSGSIQLLDYVAGDYGVDLTPPKSSVDNQDNQGGNASSTSIEKMPTPTPISDELSTFVQNGTHGNDLFMTSAYSIEDPSLFMRDWNTMAIEYTTENVVLNGGAGDDYLDSGQGNDYLYGALGNDYLLSGAGNDELQGGDGDDFLQGGSGDDKLYGENGEDRLLGQAGNDFIDGGEGADTLAGGLGDDRLYGGLGNDLYLYRGQQDGHDHLYDSGGDDILFFTDIDQQSFSQALEQQENHLIININSEHQITIYDFFNSANAIEYFVFADGRHVEATELYQQFNRTYQGNIAPYQHSHALEELQALSSLI